MDSADFAFSVDVYFATHVVIPHYSGWGSWYDIVVIDPSIMTDFEKRSVGAVTDSGSTVGKDSLGV